MIKTLRYQDRILMSCALRYSLTRSSYAPEVVLEVLYENLEGGAFNKVDLLVFKEDIEEVYNEMDIVYRPKAKVVLEEIDRILEE